MARLIDADALEFKYEFGYDHYGILCVPYRDVNESIKKAKTVDAVPIVRCKDCKHYKPQKKSAHWESRTNYCNRIVTIKVQPYDFCSYGERKEDAE